MSKFSLPALLAFVSLFSCTKQSSKLMDSNTQQVTAWLEAKKVEFPDAAPWLETVATSIDVSKITETEFSEEYTLVLVPLTINFNVNVSPKVIVNPQETKIYIMRSKQTHLFEGGNLVTVSGDKNYGPEFSNSLIRNQFLFERQNGKEFTGSVDLFSMNKKFISRTLYSKGLAMSRTEVEVKPQVAAAAKNIGAAGQTCTDYYLVTYELDSYKVINTEYLFTQCTNTSGTGGSGATGGSGTVETPTWGSIKPGAGTINPTAYLCTNANYFGTQKVGSSFTATIKNLGLMGVNANGDMFNAVVSAACISIPAYNGLTNLTASQLFANSFNAAVRDVFSALNAHTVSSTSYAVKSLLTSRTLAHMNTVQKGCTFNVNSACGGSTPVYDADDDKCSLTPAFSSMAA